MTRVKSESESRLSRVWVKLQVNQISDSRRVAMTGVKKSDNSDVNSTIAQTYR